MFKLIKHQNRWIALAMIGLMITGCIPQKVGVDDLTLQTVQNAIDELGRQPAQWQTTLENTITKLGQVGTQTAKEVLADVRSVYNGALGQTESTLFCSADFVGHRIQQRLQAIRHKINPQAPDVMIVPVVCSTNPDDHIQVGATQLVTYYGYDFLEFSRTHTFVVDLQYASGQIIAQNFGYVAIPHNYQLTIDIQATQYSNIDRSQGPQLVLKWGGQNVVSEGAQSALPVILPTPIPTPTPTPIPPPPHNRTLYSTKRVAHWASFSFGGSGDEFVNTGVLMPIGCELQAVLGIHDHQQGAIYPPSESLDDGNHGFKISRQKSDPKDLGAKVHYWYNGDSAIFVRVVYGLLEANGVDCSVSGATQDTP